MYVTAIATREMSTIGMMRGFMFWSFAKMFFINLSITAPFLTLLRVERFSFPLDKIFLRDFSHLYVIR